MKFKLKLVLASALLAAGFAVSAQTIIKFSHVVAVDTPKGKAAEFFAKKAAELTQGKVKVEVYANSALYKDKEEMEALQIGSVQMLAPSLAKFGPLGVKEFEAFDLPFIFDNTEALHKVTKGEVGAGLLKKLEPRGIKGLAYWDNGFKSFSANFPLKTAADFKGKKFRIQSSKVLEEEIRSVDGLPVERLQAFVGDGDKAAGIIGMPPVTMKLHPAGPVRCQETLDVGNRRCRCGHFRVAVGNGDEVGTGVAANLLAPGGRILSPG